MPNRLFEGQIVTLFFYFNYILAHFNNFNIWFKNFYKELKPSVFKLFLFKIFIKSSIGNAINEFEESIIYFFY